MAKVALYNIEGKKVGDLDLAPALFEVKANNALVHQAVITQQANSREVIAHTKGRAEVRGGGRKPWKQKGTGRARHGSTRSPIWVGGGVTFGPTNQRNFSLKMNRQARRKALAMTLTDKVAHDHFIAVESLTMAEAKTKFAAAMLAKMPMAGKKTLIVCEPDNKIITRLTRNIPNVKAISAKSVNVVDVLSYDYILASTDAVRAMESTFVD